MKGLKLLTIFLTGIIALVSCDKGNSSPEKHEFKANWKTAKDVLDNLYWAQENGKTYYSNFHYYNPRWETQAEGQPKSSRVVSAEEMMTSSGPKVFGHDIKITGMDFYYASGTWFPKSYIENNRKNIVTLVKEAWKRNGTVPSFSWHLENPYIPSNESVSKIKSMGCRYRWVENPDVTSDDPNYPDEHRYLIYEILNNTGTTCGYGNSTGVDNAVTYPNPRAWFEARCEEVAGIINEFVGEDGEPIPFIFRLWHELEDNWHWWGPVCCNENDYKAFWKLTRELIYKYAPKAQIVWAYCTDVSSAAASGYLRRYPGDAYVDILGYDDYNIGANDSRQRDAVDRAKNVTYYAQKHKKVAGIFETNLARTTDVERRKIWFSEYVQTILNNPSIHIGIFQLWGFYDDEANNPILIADRKKFMESDNIIVAN